MSIIEGLGVVPDWTPEMVEAVAAQLEGLAKRLREGKIALRGLNQERSFNRYYDDGGDILKMEPTGRQSIKIEYDVIASSP